MKALRGLALLSALALGACAAESEGQGENNNTGVGAQGGVGGGGAGGATGGMGAAGMMMPAGMGGSAGMTMTMTGGAGGMMATGGAAGDVASGGVGGMMPSGGMGGSGGMDMMTGGMGGSGGMEMTGGTGGGMDWGPDKGEGDGTDVITMGDSYMNLNGFEGTEVSLEKVSGRDYRNYGVAGTQLLDGRIPAQFDSAVRANPNIKTVVISAGGNDILLGMITCTIRWTTACDQQVRDVAAGHMELRQHMGSMGVEDVIWVHYGYSTAGSAEPDPNLKPGLDLAREMAVTGCTPDMMPRCHFIDPVEELYGKIRSDGIHPTGEGYDILGQMVWDTMQERGIRR